MRKLLALLLLTTAALAQDASRVLTGSAIAPLPLNIITQPGFEARTTGWSSTAGTFTTTTTIANVARGIYSASFTLPASAAIGVTLQSVAVTVPAGLQGRSCRIGALYKGAALTNGSMVIDAYDGTTIYGQAALANTSGSGFVKTSTNLFTCPSSGTLRARFRNTLAGPATPTAMYFDEVYLTNADDYGFVNPMNAPGDMIYNNAGGSPDRIPIGTVGMTLTQVGGIPSWVNPILKSVTTTYQALNEDSYVIGDTTSGAFTITLPEANNPNKVITIAKSNASTVNLLTIASFSGSQTIGPGAQTSVTLASPNSKITLIQDADLQTWKVVDYKDNWKVDSNISGGNPSLGTGNVASYTGIESSAFTLTNNSGTGTITAQIGCSSTNAPTGTTCSVGNESTSVSMTPPGLYPQDVQVCASFQWAGLVSNTSTIDVAFQVVETATNAQTITQEGKTRITTGVNNPNVTNTIGGNTPFRNCGVFTLASSSQKMFRLMYEQSISGTALSSTVTADANASAGQRDIHWEIYPLNK